MSEPALPPLPEGTMYSNQWGTLYSEEELLWFARAFAIAAHKAEQAAQALAQFHTYATEQSAQMQARGLPTDEQIVSLYHAKYHQAPDEDYVQGWHDCAAARPQAAEPTEGNWIAAEDVLRNVKALDEALNGPGGATRPLLIDVLAQVQGEVRKRGRPLLAAAEPGDERARFEAHIKGQFPSATDELLIGRSKSGSYGSMVTEHAWRAWCAALAPAAAGGETPCP